MYGKECLHNFYLEPKYSCTQLNPEIRALAKMLERSDDKKICDFIFSELINKAESLYRYRLAQQDKSEMFIVAADAVEKSLKGKIIKSVPITSASMEIHTANGIFTLSVSKNCGSKENYKKKKRQNKLERELEQIKRDLKQDEIAALE